MDKKYYLIPESTVITLEIKNSILSGSFGSNDPEPLNGGNDNGEGGENFDPNLY